MPGRTELHVTDTPHTVALVLEQDRQVTAKGRVLVALADASEATAAAIVEVLAARQADHAIDAADVDRLAFAAGQHASDVGRMHYRGVVEPGVVRRRLAKAAAYLLAAIETLDETPAAPATQDGSL